LKVASPGMLDAEIDAALIAAAVTFPAVEIAIAPNGVVSPRSPVKVIFPEPALRLRFCAPSIVLEKKIFPPDALVLNVEVPTRFKVVL